MLTEKKIQEHFAQQTKTTMTHPNFWKSFCESLCSLISAVQKYYLLPLRDKAIVS